MPHIPVLLEECIENLNIDPSGVYVDGTLGGAGHAVKIADKLRGGLLIGIDRDMDAVLRSKEKLAAANTVLVHGNFTDITQILDSLNIERINGMILDLGVSSFQLDEDFRGFSYMNDGPLDMRMDRSLRTTAEDIVNTYGKERLADVLLSYGEEKWAVRIADFIVRERQAARIKTTFELVSVIKKAIPKKAREEGQHPAKRTFQAIRIELNRELTELAQAIEAVTQRLASGARLLVITFHSLEDRITKNTYKKLTGKGECSCPSGVPFCVCGAGTDIPQAKIITKKPITPSETEIRNNPRSRSAKLRVIEKIGD